MFKIKYIAAVVLASFTGSLAFAAAPLDEAKLTTPIPAVLKMAQGKGNLIVKKDFKAAGGLTGWLVINSQDGKPLIVYTTPDGEVLLAGIALDKTGSNLTAEYSKVHIPAADYTAAFADFSATGPSSGISLGSKNAKAEITVMHDANCTYCKILHSLLAPAVAAGELRVRYVPVAILGADSGTKGAALLAAKDPLAALDSHSNGGRVDVSADAELLAKVKTNTDLMRKHGFNGTPTVLYRGKNGAEETMNVSNGLPGMLPFFKSLGISGQIDKLKGDPKLAKYLQP